MKITVAARTIVPSTSRVVTSVPLSLVQLDRQHLAVIVVRAASLALHAERQVNGQKIGTTTTETTKKTTMTAAPSRQ